RAELDRDRFVTVGQHAHEKGPPQIHADQSGDQRQRLRRAFERPVAAQDQRPAPVRKQQRRHRHESEQPQTGLDQLPHGELAQSTSTFSSVGNAVTMWHSFMQIRSKNLYLNAFTFPSPSIDMARPSFGNSCNRSWRKIGSSSALATSTMVRLTPHRPCNTPKLRGSFKL